jgi:hypothetical protein
MINGLSGDSFEILDWEKIAADSTALTAGI